MDKLYVILQVCDSAFPTGGFSHSAGVEAAVQKLYIKSPGDFKIFAISSLENAGSLFVPFIKAAYENYKDNDKLCSLDALLNTMILNHVAHRASIQQGRALLNTSFQVFSSPVVTNINNLIVDDKIGGHFPIVYAAVCAALDIPVIQVARMFLFNSLRTIVASIIRLGKIGAIQAQKLQYEIQACLDDIISRNWTHSPEEAHISFTVVEVLQNTHDTMFTKLFFS